MFPLGQHYLFLPSISLTLAIIILPLSVVSNFTQCVNDPASEELVRVAHNLDKLEFQRGIWYFPLAILDRGNELNRRIPLIGREGFEWHSNALPSNYSDNNQNDYYGLPPDFKPFKNIRFPRRRRRNKFPFWHFRRDVSSWGYQKWAGFPKWVLPEVGRDVRTAKSNDIFNSIFSMNVQDRGVDNHMKKVYLSALTCDKLAFYESKIDAALENFFNDVTSLEQPILSSWSRRVSELYLDLHLEGATGHPKYITDYIQQFTKLLSPGQWEFIATKLPEVRELTCYYPEVQAYFDERRQYILDNEINSTFIYWWDQAGMPSEMVLYEAVHNILAWGQFINTLFLVIRSKLQGYLAIDNLLEGVVDPPPTIDFFAKIQEAVTVTDRLNVAREIFRILIPNAAWVSRGETEGRSSNDGKILTDPGFEEPYTMHLGIAIQALNDNFNPRTFDTDLSKYDTSRYQDFSVSGCPFASGDVMSPDSIESSFTVSERDGETVVPKSHKEYFAVFAASQEDDNETTNGPKYCPFGLGYRRCPGELFNYFLIEKLLLKLSTLNFEVRGENVDLFENIERDNPDFNDSIPMGLPRARDSIFVSQ